MTKAARSVVFIFAVLAMAGCSTAAPATSVPQGTAAPGGSPSGAPTAAAAPTAAPPAQGLHACGIVTTAEVEAIIGSVVTTDPIGDAGDGQTICTFRSADGEGLLYTAHDPDGVAGFEVWKSSSGVQMVPAIGDEAIYVESIGLLVRRGQATFQFYPLADLDADEALALAVQLAQAASSRF